MITFLKNYERKYVSTVTEQILMKSHRSSVKFRRKKKKEDIRFYFTIIPMVFEKGSHLNFIICETLRT